MIAFIIRRLIQSVFVMLVVALVAFLMFNYVGDPVNQMVGIDTSFAQRAHLRQELGLNDPALVQFARFVGHAVRGDFGLSYQHKRPVAELFKERLPATLTAEPLLQIEHLRIVFDTRRGTLVAVDDVSFDVNRGEVFGIVGESGAGKSLTGQAIIGLLEPPGKIAAGQIHLEGQRIDNLPYARLRRLRGKQIGMIFQDPLTSLNPLYTIGRQLTETILTHRNMNHAQARRHAVQILSDVGIPAAEKRIDHYPHQFSGGMRQRVVIALALCVNPKLVIADEPTTALDVSIQAQIIALLRQLCETHSTAVVLITHDMGVIAEICDRVAVMYAGRIVELGNVRQIVKHARHPYASGLMGSIPSPHHRQQRLNQIDGNMPRLSKIPAGCAFHTRCPHAFEKCRRQQPQLIKIEEAQVACWLYGEKT